MACILSNFEGWGPTAVAYKKSVTSLMSTSVVLAQMSLNLEKLIIFRLGLNSMEKSFYDVITLKICLFVKIISTSYYLQFQNSRNTILYIESII